MEIKELGQKADNVIELSQTMNRVFNSRNWDSNLKIAIMAGLKDAYNEGMKVAEAMAGKTNKNFQDISTSCNVRIHKITKPRIKKGKK